MIKREAYMSRIRPFIGGELIKVITGIRRSGKSVMLELIKDELAAAGVGRESVVSINFEDMRFARLLTARALQSSICMYVKMTARRLRMPDVLKSAWRPYRRHARM